jgi:hypothetical protein
MNHRIRFMSLSFMVHVEATYVLPPSLRNERLQASAFGQWSGVGVGGGRAVAWGGGGPVLEKGRQVCLFLFVFY